MQRQTEPNVRTIFRHTYFYRNPSHFEPKVSTRSRKHSPSSSMLRLVASLVIGVALLLAAAANAQAQFGSQPTGATTGNQGVTVTASVAGTVTNVEVLSLGSSSGDFAA